MKKPLVLLLCAILAAPVFAQEEKAEKKKPTRAEHRREVREKRREANEKRREERRERRKAAEESK